MAEKELGSWFNRMMLRKGRLAQGKTQRQVADEVLISTDSYRDYEAGRTGAPGKNIKALAEACGLSKEEANFMLIAALAHKSSAAVEADMRFNALYLALAEEYYGTFFKFDANLIPGPLQLQEYQYIVLRLAEGATEEQLDRGWLFKDGRAETIWNRLDRPTIQFLIGETALHQLREISAELYQAQMAYLRRWSRKPGVSIRIQRGPIPARLSSFDVYMQGESELSGPPFVYTEIADSSWLIDDPARIASYDGIRKNLWKKAIRIEVYNDDDWRDRLA
ncbi:Scr1 family TA system antitoxin-like transcriptional regulator [Glycomyces luteolus]|uniref:Scr1 family TA system antitoxin-like transcriptional regulator n=1 Tax=Glycomyces luteolus TaxID=2670330 RepID=A0A9X3P8V8_9ACTN|nr:Scr1 family TA system antitoxin-like transcriptional regulator [Glycomyces luteolus]MDA1360487.1 Scr1 family TA system antitoxin-like transcriptional regulator [Glycomyces luteolus]